MTGRSTVLAVQAERGAGSHGVTGLTNPRIDQRVDAHLLEGPIGTDDVTCAPHTASEPDKTPAKAGKTAGNAGAAALPRFP